MHWHAAMQDVEDLLGPPLTPSSLELISLIKHAALPTIDACHARLASLSLKTPDAVAPYQAPGDLPRVWPVIIDRFVERWGFHQWLSLRALATRLV